ncbi:MAG: YceI family protein [Anaerolineae bacterium]
MSRTARLIVAGIVVVLVVVLIGLVYIWVSGGSATPSATLVAPTLELATRQPTTEATPEAASAASTESPAAATAESTAESAATEAAAAATPESAASASDLTVFGIVADDSEVRFILNEMLRGSPNEVRGTTSLIAGQIGVDFANPQNSQVGEIRIDARDLSTDNEMRNRAIRSAILQSAQDQFEFISFKPTSLDGLPASVTMGEAFEFQVTGDLTIRDITNPVTFDVTVTPVSETRIEGTATATVQRGDYGLTIPNVPGVADVDEAVRLEIDFVATPVS